MSGMFGGSGGGSVPPPMPQPTFQPVPQTELPSGPYGGLGYTQVPQTFTPQAMPWWMSASPAGQSGVMPGQQHNWFGAPWWGLSAATNQPLTQRDLQPQRMRQARPKRQDRTPSPQPERQPDDLANDYRWWSSQQLLSGEADDYGTFLKQGAGRVFNPLSRVGGLSKG